MKLKNGLTHKQDIFCREYIIDYNATQAAIRAGYSEHTAKEIGCENLTKPNIKSHIDTLIEERKAKIEINEGYVLDKLMRYNEANIMDFYEIDENKQLVLKDLTKLPRRITDSISEIRQTKDGLMLKIVDKKGSAVDIGRYLGMFTDNLKVTDDTIEDLITRNYSDNTGGIEESPAANMSDAPKKARKQRKNAINDVV